MISGRGAVSRAQARRAPENAPAGGACNHLAAGDDRVTVDPRVLDAFGMHDDAVPTSRDITNSLASTWVDDGRVEDDDVCSHSGREDAAILQTQQRRRLTGEPPHRGLEAQRSAFTNPPKR